MKKKYIIVLGVIIILLVSGFIIFKSIGDEKQVFEETRERASEDYKITGDLVLVNTSSNESDNNTNNMGTTTTESNLIFTSSSFINQESILSKYTCDGDNISPAFQIAGVSENAKSLVLIMNDLDAQTEVWTHWIKFNIPVDTQEILEGEEPEGISGEGTGGNLEYFGPCPPENEHRYVFKLYSLETELTLPEGSTKEEVEKAMGEHILQTAELVGKYERQLGGA